MAGTRSVRRLRQNLPAQPTLLIGREHDVTTVARLLQAGGGRLVTLTGAGGCGKTRLALAVTTEVASAFHEGPRFVELAALTEAAFVPQAVASALGVNERANRTLLESLVDYLMPRHGLLVLDNCEHLIDACAALADRLLRACPALRLLATSREPLRIPGEVTWRVPSLAVPDLRRSQPPADLMQVASVRLFVERALAVQPAFRLTSRNAPAVAAICARLEGLPLAIELAAAWERVLGTVEILSRLDDTFKLLVGGSRTAPSRQQTLLATLEWSHTSLSQSEQALFRRLAVFAGGWSLSAAETVCAGGEVMRDDVLALLARLVDTSMAIEEERDGRARYRLLEPVRAFAADLLVQSNEVEVTQRAHAMFFLARAAELATALRADPAELGVFGERLDALEREYPNFKKALQWFGDTNDIETGLLMAHQLGMLWQTRGHLTEGRASLSRLLQLPGGSPGLRAAALGWAGNLALLQGDPVAAQVLHAEALRLAREAGNNDHVAAILNALGRDALVLGDYRETERLCEEALRCYQTLSGSEIEGRRVVAVHEEIWTLYTLGMAAYEQGDMAKAQAFHTRCLERTNALGNVSVVINWALSGLARVAHQQGDYHRARALHEQALANQRELDEPARVALTLVGLGNVLLDLEDHSGARAAFTESLDVFEELGDPSGLARVLDGFAGLVTAENQPQCAWRLVGAAERLRELGRTPASPVERADLARRLDPSRQVIGEEAVLAAMDSGRALDTAGAVALARATEVVPESEARPQPAVAGSTQGVLSRRESEVAALIARGMSNREISQQLVITRRTAATHVEHIFGKLGFTSRTQVGIWASEHGLLASASPGIGPPSYRLNP